MITSIKSPFLEYKMTILRNKKTSNSLFRQTMNEASYLIAAEVLKHLQYKKISVQTPLTKTTGVKLAQQVILVPILRAGLGLLEGFVKFLPDAEKGHIGLYRDEQTYEPVEYLFKLPKTKNKKVLVLDPMLATGNTSIAAINLIKNKGVKAKDLDWSYYSLDNLQTLCKPCHRKKTNSEVHLKKKRKTNFKGTKQWQ